MHLPTVEFPRIKCKFNCCI